MNDTNANVIARNILLLYLIEKLKFSIQEEMLFRRKICDIFDFWFSLELTRRQREETLFPALNYLISEEGSKYYRLVFDEAKEQAERIRKTFIFWRECETNGIPNLAQIKLLKNNFFERYANKYDAEHIALAFLRSSNGLK